MYNTHLEFRCSFRENKCALYTGKYGIVLFSVQMATFKETREILLASYASNIITIEEYALLFEENSSNNLDFPYYNYPPFNLESQSQAECRANFRVEKHHIPLVEDALQIPQYFVCDQETVCEGTEGLDYQMG